MKKRFLLIMLLLVLCTVVEFIKISLNECLALPNEFYVDYDEVQSANSEQQFGKFVKLSINDKQTSIDNNGGEENFVVVKLFGFIPVKKIKAKILPEEEVFVGGEVIGLAVNCDGTVVVSNCTIDENKGEVVKNNFFKNGDIISRIGEKDISSLDDVQSALKNQCDSQVKVEVVRNNRKLEQIVPLLKDKDGTYRLGIWGKDDLSGVGTITFVKQNGQFGALGHAITHGSCENVIPVKDGRVYECNMVGIKKGQRNDPGELRCVFVPKNAKGEIYKNTKQGIYGKLESTSGLIDLNLTAKLGGRLSIKPGKAKIVSCVSGIREEYEIEIIKANYQNSIDEKSIVFRVTDNKLLNLTGGIVQGMSGSPIMQNGKIVGAVTHVFLNDPTKGYGVYTDWMLSQLEV